MEKNNQPKKLGIKDRIAMFEPKNSQGNKNGEKPKEIPKIKKINGQELFNKMNNDLLQKNQEQKNPIQAQRQRTNTVYNSSNVFDIINKINKQQSELKQKQINDQKSEAERKEKAKITCAKTMEKQKAKLIADKEKKAKEEEEKRKKEEEKAKKEKEFRERNDKARCSLNFDQNISVNFNDYSRDKFVNFISKYEDRGSISEEQDVNILMDFSSRKGSIVISGFEEEMITSQFPNCILYENNSIYKHKIFDDNTIKKSKIVYPVKQGNFYDYALLELLIDCAYHEKIRLAPEECGIIFTEPINCFKEDREKIAQIFFEDYNIPKLFIIKPTVLTLLSEGKYTGIVAQLDDDVSNFVPVFDCFKLDKASIRSDFGRKDLIDYMEILLNDKYYFITNYNKSVIEKIVGECYVALNYEKELYNLEEFNYLLPDGKEISIKEQRIKCPEILINPSNYFKDTNNENKSIVKNIDNSIKKCDEDKQKDLYNNIYLTGINSNFGGLKERVKLELENLKSYSSNYDIQVFNNSQGIEKGVENFFSNKAFEGMWITREEYEEEGATVVNKKFQ